MPVHDTDQSVLLAAKIPHWDTYVRNIRCISPSTCMMSLLNSEARFEPTIEPTSPVDSPSVCQNYEPIYPPAAIAAKPALDQAPDSKKAAKPAPSRVSPWLLSLVYPLGRYLVFPAYFGRIEITGQEHLPRSGATILAPTHRSRWDAIMVPYVAGHHVTRRHLRFMVSADEMTGLQGWFIRRLGGFPINTTRPAIASLRHGVELLEAGEALVIFPEGNIFYDEHVQTLKPGLARLALQAQTSQPDSGVKIVPITVHYSRPLAPWRCRVKIQIGAPLNVSDYATGCAKKDARTLTAALQSALESLS